MMDEKPSWWVAPVDKAGHSGCLHCPDPQIVAPMDMVVAVGFGSAHVQKDDEIVWFEKSNLMDWDDFWTTADAEKAAVEDPDHDWRIVKFGPLHGETYQRHGPGEWVMIENNTGFA